MEILLLRFYHQQWVFLFLHFYIVLFSRSVVFSHSFLFFPYVLFYTLLPSMRLFCSCLLSVTFRTFLSVWVHIALKACLFLFLFCFCFEEDKIILLLCGLLHVCCAFFLLILFMHFLPIPFTFPHTCGLCSSPLYLSILFLCVFLSFVFGCLSFFPFAF